MHVVAINVSLKRSHEQCIFWRILCHYLMDNWSKIILMGSPSTILVTSASAPLLSTHSQKRSPRSWLAQMGSSWSSKPFFQQIEGFLSFEEFTWQFWLILKLQRDITPRQKLGSPSLRTTSCSNKVSNLPWDATDLFEHISGGLTEFTVCRLEQRAREQTTDSFWADLGRPGNGEIPAKCESIHSNLAPVPFLSGKDILGGWCVRLKQSEWSRSFHWDRSLFPSEIYWIWEHLKWLMDKLFRNDFDFWRKIYVQEASRFI